MHDDQTIQVYNTHIEKYAEVTKRDQADPVLLHFIGQFSKGDFILDLGCGLAEASAEMVCHGLQVDPVDASIEMVNTANQNHHIGARQAVFDDIDGQNIYHGVWANFSLLHAGREDFPKILAALCRAMKPNGYFHIGMKTGSGAARDRLGRYYTYYSQSELVQLLEQAGFKAVKIETGSDAGLSGSVDPWITILSQKGL